MQLHQEVNEDDPDRTMLFYEIFQVLGNRNPPNSNWMTEGHT